VPEWLILVLGSRVALLAISRLFGTRAGAAASGAAAAAVLAIGAQIWVPAVAIGQHSSGALLEHWSRLIPSGWAIGLSGAVSRGEFAPVVGFSVALLVAPILLFRAFQLLVVGVGRSARPTSVVRMPLRAGNPSAAALAKEIRSWTRDPFRSYAFAFSVAYAITFCALPLVLHLHFFIALIPALFLAMFAALSANSYGADGTVLWITEMIPRSARIDVRARQIAWLTIATPLAVVLFLPVLLTPDLHQLVPAIVASLLALLGCGAGIAILTSVLASNPLTDPNRRGADALNLGGDTVRALLVVLAVLVLMSLVAVPVYFVTLKSPGGGLLLGAGIGLLAFVGCGILAASRLDRNGAKLLQRMLDQNDEPVPTAVQETSEYEPLSRRQSLLAGACWAIAWLPTFAQGLAPAIVLATHGDPAPWLLATRLPEDYRWPVIGGTIAFGLIIYAVGVAIPVRHRLLNRGERRHFPTATKQPTS
jgi:ABC-2 type transport system permease protein